MPNTETKPAKPANQPPNQTPDTAKASNTPTRAKASRKIDAEVIAQMAQAVATMLTESEAARRCAIEPRHWFEWKSRAGRAGKFAALLEQFRANKIAGLLDRVQKSADGVDVKFPDFRAALALLKFQDKARFGDSPTVEVNFNALALSDKELLVIAQKMRAARESATVETASVPKQIRDAKLAPERVDENENSK
jgi:hypothetical protein